MEKELPCDFMNLEEVLKKLKSMGNPKNVEGLARYGINPKNNLGISIYKLRLLAKVIGKNHELSLKLWESGRESFSFVFLIRNKTGFLCRER